MTKAFAALTAACALVAPASARTAVPPDLRDRLDERGIAVRDAWPTTPRVAARQAVRVAGRNTPYASTGGAPFAHLVYYTNRASGPMDKLAWMVVFPNVQQPCFGRISCVYVTDTASFVDARTGRWLLAATT